jgi:general stress protein YciG
MATKQEIRDYFARFGKQGGKTRAKNMTPEQRSEAARKAVQARWNKIDSSMKELSKNLKKLERRQAARKAAKDGPAEAKDRRRISRNR